MTPDPRALDMLARRAIRERLGESLVVEAGAGTGKTHELVDRLEALIRSGRARIDQIVAITFTRAAAAELRERVRSRLEGLARSTPAGSEVAARIGAALEGLDGAAIETIDAFALSLLRERPLDAGLPPKLEPLDEVGSALALADRWRAWLDTALDGKLGPQLGHAIRLGFPDPFRSLDEIARVFHENYDLLRRIEVGAPRTDPRRPGAAQTLVDARSEIQALLAHERPGAAADVAAKLRAAADIARRLGRTGASGEAALYVLADSPPLRTSRGRQDEWGKLANGRWAVSEAKALLAALYGDIERDLREARAAALVPILRSVAAFALEYAAERRRDGTPEFHDLLVWACDLLGVPGDGTARRSFRDRYQYLLIDEFQDTDPLQTALALALTSAKDGRVEPGALFVVGDPKQSIYRFRRADLSSLRRVRERTGDVPVHLTITRRAHTGLVQWINQAFGGWMGRTEGTTQATYVDLVSERGAPDASGSGIWSIGGEITATNLEPVRRAERPHIVDVARSIGAGEWTVTDKGRDGREILRSSKFADLCILFPNRTALPDLERALEEAEIPYSVEGQALAFDTQDLRDLINCLTAMDDPSDEVAVVAALRSPAFACSDVDLYDWVKVSRKFSYLGRVPEGGPVGSALAVLRRYHDDRQRLTPTYLVERFIRELRLRELALEGARARERWRLFSVVIEQARVLAEGGRGSLRDLVRWCEERRERQERTADGGVAELDVSAVRLMTFHYAKGLEFPIVLLTGLSGRRAGDRARVRFDHSEMVPDDRKLAIRIKDFGYGDYGDLLEREKVAAEEEAVRLMYVAATRARDHLIISLYRKTGDSGCLASKLVRHVGERSPLWRALAIRPASAIAAGIGAGDGQGPTDIEAERGRWLAGRAEAIANASRPYAVAATALARGSPVDGNSPDDMRSSGDRGDTGTLVPAEEEPWRRGRGGTSLGRAVHAALQDIDLRTGKDLAAICERQALAEGIHDADGIGEVKRLVEAVIRQDLIRRAAEARHWKEVYVAVPLPALAGGVLEGFVDLVYEEPPGDLGIVDYKTDTTGKGTSLERAARPYRLQLGAYAHAIEAVTGRRVAAAHIVFARRAAEGAAAAYALPDLEAAKRGAREAGVEFVSRG
ncbi:MAG: UvrD-helicase domain-containing protein [Chloroflexi bacterium]|nr:UvrD-helicase domain-containing protein [Chloroflexota bacterium]